jgi:glycosyltransferase involved in cell wall biosynthesis
MKILLVQDYLRSGGTERQTVLLARAFAAAGHATHLVTFRPGGALRPTEAVANLTLHALQRRDARLDWWAPRLRHHARGLAPDVVICMGRMANCYGRALQVALPASVVVSTMRTGKTLPLAFRQSLHHTRHVIANSHAAAAHLASVHQVTPDRMSVIPNGLIFGPTKEASPAERDQLRSKNGASPHDVVLLNIAMFRPEKNQGGLLDMAKRLDPSLAWQLWLAGDGATLAKCRRHAASLGLGDRVKFLGWHADPRPLYRAADLAVHASKRESLSNFLIEAQAHGLPAVAAAARGVDETFVDSQSGFLISPGDLPGFAAAVTRLLKDPSLRTKMSAAAELHAAACFSTAAQVKAHLDLFAKLTSLTATA